MKSKKLSNLIFVFVFLLFLVVVMITTIVKPKLLTSYFENRTLAKMPEISFRALASDNYFLGWERYLADHAAGRQTLLITATSIDLNVIKRPVVNDVVVLDGLYLRYNEFEPADEKLISEQSKVMAAEMSALDRVITSYGGHFYYVAIPTHYIWYDDEYPWYLNSRKDQTAQSLEAFISDMADEGVDLILPFLGLTPENTRGGDPLFSTSDHHFTFFGAYKTYRAIIEKINSDGEYSLPLLDTGDFEFLTLPNPFMGSRMRNLMNIPGLTEHATIAVLNEEIPFTRTDNGRLFKNPFVYYRPNTTWSTVDYGIYMGGDYAETVLDTGRDLPNILLFGESFTNAVECILYYSCGEMRSVDLRYYHDMPMSEYVETYKPDIVICMRGYSAMLLHNDNGKVMN